jgi:hypothetical protein
MCILTSPLQSSHGPLSLAFGKGVLKSLGTRIARSPHYHVLGPSLICLSPQVSLATEYLASHEYSIEYHFHTVSLEEHQQSSTHTSREHLWQHLIHQILLTANAAVMAALVGSGGRGSGGGSDSDCGGGGVEVSGGSGGSGGGSGSS